MKYTISNNGLKQLQYLSNICGDSIEKLQENYLIRMEIYVEHCGLSHDEAETESMDDLNNLLGGSQ